ncbi:MAG: cobyrinic acid a,c-diamide synthase, partial [Candidatus Methanomethylophilaceae archaeon]|nr:cobyrinic acid a,c-diamide synthase [Candidatus Methanomethylophilaceae archaeon]
VDIPRLIELAGTAPDMECSAPEVQRVDGPVRIGLAEDEAFCFTYEDNLELLRRCGAEIVPFSPIRDAHLPDVDGLIFSGGYPELHSAELSANKGMMEEIRTKIEGGMPCLAECGGFMYLHDRMEGSDGEMYGMCGVIHGEVTNKHKLTRFGYVDLTPNGDGTVGGDIRLKGHEFHYWDSDNCGGDWTATKTTANRSYGCIHDTRTMIAGYPHMYYYSDVRFPYRFLQRAREYRANVKG